MCANFSRHMTRGLSEMMIWFCSYGKSKSLISVTMVPWPWISVSITGDGWRWRWRVGYSVWQHLAVHCQTEAPSIKQGVEVRGGLHALWGLPCSSQACQSNVRLPTSHNLLKNNFLLCQQNVLSTWTPFMFLSAILADCIWLRVVIHSTCLHWKAYCLRRRR